MNIRHTLLLLSLLPSTATAYAILDDDVNFNIRGAVPTPSSINKNAPTPGALTPSISDVHLRRLGKPPSCVCRPQKGQFCGCPPPPPTTPLAPTTPTPTCAPAPDLQCTSTNDDGISGNTQCFYDTSFGCGLWRMCLNSCLPFNDPCQACPNQDRFRCTPDDPQVSVLEDPSLGTVNVPGSRFSCYDGYGGYYGGGGNCGTLAGGACCEKGLAQTNNGCHPVVTTTGTTSTTATEATDPTTTTTTTTTTTGTTTTTTEAAQCAKPGEYCRGKNAMYDTCCESLTCGSGSDKTCS